MNWTRYPVGLCVLTLIAAALSAHGPVYAQGNKGPKSYVEVTPETGSLQVGQQTQLRAAVLNPVGFDLANKKVSWRSSDPSIATVNTTGLVTALAPGSVTIVATSGAALGSAAISVSAANTAPVLTITAPSDGAAFPESTPITFTATAQDQQDGDLGAAIAWSVALADDVNGTQFSLGTGASVSHSLAKGSYLVTAGVTDSGGLGTVKQVGITVGCTLTADVQPASGEKIPQLLQLDASSSHDTCGRPLQYFWGCQSDTSTYCFPFVADANGNNNTNATPAFNLQEFDIVQIWLKVCVAGTTECTPPADPSGPPQILDANFTVQRIYEGAAVGGEGD